MLTMTTSPVRTLQQLLLNEKGARSYEQFSRDCGGYPTRQRLQQLATTELLAFPDAKTIAGVARGTTQPVTSVVLAAAQSLGLRVSSGVSEEDMIIAGGGLFAEEQRRALLAVARTFAAMNREANFRLVVRQQEGVIAQARQMLDNADQLISTEQAAHGLQQQVISSLNELKDARGAIKTDPALHDLMDETLTLVHQLTDISHAIGQILMQRRSTHQTEFELAASAGEVQQSPTVGDQSTAGEENQDPDGGA